MQLYPFFSKVIQGAGFGLRGLLLKVEDFGLKVYRILRLKG